MRGLAKNTKELSEYARGLLEVDHPQTLRQLHYAIFSRQEIDYANDKASYGRLSRVTTLARRSYREWELAGEIGTEPAVSIPPGNPQCMERRGGLHRGREALLPPRQLAGPGAPCGGLVREGYDHGGH